MKGSLRLAGELAAAPLDTPRYVLTARFLYAHSAWVGRPVQACQGLLLFMRRFTLLMPLFMQLFMLRILLLSLCSLRPVLLDRRADLVIVAAPLRLGAITGS